MKVDDDWYMQARFSGLTPDATDLYRRLEAWCNQRDNLTDGLVPVTQPAMLFSTLSTRTLEQCLEELLAVNPFTGRPLLERSPVGFRLRDYLDDQKSRDQVREYREQGAERARRSRENARKKATSATQESLDVTAHVTRDVRRTFGVTHGARSYHLNPSPSTQYPEDLTPPNPPLSAPALAALEGRTDGSAAKAAQGRERVLEWCREQGVVADYARANELCVLEAWPADAVIAVATEALECGAGYPLRYFPDMARRLSEHSPLPRDVSAMVAALAEGLAADGGSQPHA